MLSIEYRGSLWTVCIDGKPAFTFASLEQARALVPEATVVHS